MANEKIKAPAFDDIVFENRNKEYGAYKLRKKYSRNVLISMLIGIVILSYCCYYTLSECKSCRKQS